MRIASLGFSLAEYNPAKADAQGQFEFAGIPKADVYTLSVSAKGYGSLSQQLQMPESPTNRLQFPTFVLPLANQVLGGQILDADGNPAARGLVQAWAISRVVHPVPGKPDAWDVQTVVGRTQGAAQTDSQGRFFFNAICEGPIQLTLLNLGPVVTVQTTAGATDIVLRLPNYRNDINNVGAVPAQAAVKITGTMRDPSGAPAAGVPVVWWNRGNVLETTDPLGRFSITWPNGADHMVLLARDMERNLSGIRELDGSITDVDLSLKPALTISVKAQDAGGRPIPTATGTLALKLDKTIMVFNWPLPVRADEQGCIEFQGLPQGMSYSATITSRGFTTATVAAPLEATRTNRLQLPPAVLRVPDLEDAEEYPIPDE
jgi:hypothetical protein